MNEEAVKIDYKTLNSKVRADELIMELLKEWDIPYDNVCAVTIHLEYNCVAQIVIQRLMKQKNKQSLLTKLSKILNHE